MFLHDFLLRDAAQHGIKSMPLHDAMQRVAIKFCATKGGQSEATEMLLRLFANIDDECEQAAEQRQLKLAQAAAPHMSLGIAQNSGDIIEDGGAKTVAFHS